MPAARSQLYAASALLGPHGCRNDNLKNSGSPPQRHIATFPARFLQEKYNQANKQKTILCTMFLAVA